jgi:SNF2 family DNA or RNA helicase
MVPTTAEIFQNSPWTESLRHRVKENNPEAIKLGKVKGDEISERLKPLYLSRKKDVVLKDELPKKVERIVFCDPTPLQKQLYQHVIKQPDFILLSQASLPCDCGVNLKFFLEYQQLTSKSQQIEYQRKNKNLIVKRSKCCYKVPTDDNAVLWRKQHMNGEQCDKCPFCVGFPAINILLKLSSHAALLQAKVPPEQFAVGCTEHTTAVEDLNKARVFIPPSLLDKMPGGSHFRNDGIMNDHFALSGKMRVLSKLLKAISKRQGRVLLFSAWTQMLDLIQNYMKSEGYTHLRMDGSTPAKKREEYVDLFMADENCFIFLLSTKAMALGLNLTGADHVIIFDVEWFVFKSLLVLRTRRLPSSHLTISCLR